MPLDENVPYYFLPVKFEPSHILTVSGVGSYKCMFRLGLSSNIDCSQPTSLCTPNDNTFFTFFDNIIWQPIVFYIV